jgi:hypothetical protein
MLKGQPPIQPDRRADGRDDVAIHFHRTEWWRNVMMGSLVALIAAVALLATAIENPWREGDGFIAVVLTVCFSASFVMTAIRAAQLRHLRARMSRGLPKTRRPMTRRDLVVYLVAFGAAAAVGLLYVQSQHGIDWVWPTFVTIVFLVVGVVLLLRGRD